MRLWTNDPAGGAGAVLFIVVLRRRPGGADPPADGVPYEVFIVPGLALMGVATARSRTPPPRSIRRAPTGSSRTR